MTQPQEAVGGEAPAPVKTEAQDPFEALAEEFLGPDEPEDDELPSSDPQDPDNAKPKDDEGEDAALLEDLAKEEAAKAAEAPPIAPPASLTNEEKEAFSKLPREAQEFTSRRINELEKGFQTKSQEAAQAQRNASIEAMKLAEQVKAEAVQHLQRYAQQFEVRPPSAELFSRDPVAYAQQLEAYQNAHAQREQAQRDAEKFRAEQAQIQQARQAEEAQAFHQQLQAEVPEIFDPENGQSLLKELTATAELLGFDPNQISDVSAIKALKATSEWKAKAEKYDALMKKQMERVRSGKIPPPIAKPGTARMPGETRARRASQAWETAVEGSKMGNRQARDAGFAAWAAEAGWLD